MATCPNCTANPMEVTLVEVADDFQDGYLVCKTCGDKIGTFDLYDFVEKKVMDGFLSDDLKLFWSDTVIAYFTNYMVGKTVALCDGRPFYYRIDVERFCESNALEFPIEFVKKII